MSNSRLPWKTKLPRKVLLYGMYFLHSEFLSNLRLPWKTEFALEFFTVLNMYFLSFRIFEQLTLALKNQSVPEKFLCIEYTFYIPDFEQLALALKNRGCPEYTVLNMYFLLFRIFEQRVLALKNTVYPENFHCIEYIFFIIQDFWATCACPEKQSCPGIFHCIEYVFFIIQDFLATSACLKTEFALKIFKPGGWPPVPTPCLVRLCIEVTQKLHEETWNAASNLCWHTVQDSPVTTGELWRA